jgi:tRNA(Arg) A34 adenosine deaminase TadA
MDTHAAEAEANVTAARLWADLDEAWREAFRQAWDAVRGGNIGVGACASTPEGEIIHASRNRVNDQDGPHGEIFGSSLAHAEMNVLARLEFRRYRKLVLTTTLQPCLQCSGAIRLARIGTVRFAGHDVYWDGYHDFVKLAEREGRRGKLARIGPRDDELGVFGLLISRFRLGNPRLADGFDAVLRAIGEGPVLDVAYELEDGGELETLTKMEIDQVLAAVWLRLQGLRQATAPAKPLGLARGPGPDPEASSRIPTRRAGGPAGRRGEPGPDSPARSLPASARRNARASPRPVRRGGAARRTARSRR